MEDIEAKIDRLIHDAEHREAGAEFAQRMARIDPGNPTHQRMADEMLRDAKELRDRAAALRDGNR